MPYKTWTAHKGTGVKLLKAQFIQAVNTGNVLCVLSFPFLPFTAVLNAAVKLQACQKNQVAQKILDFFSQQ